MTTRVIVGTLEDRKRGSIAAAVFYDPHTMTTFGPVMSLDQKTTQEDIRELAEGFRDYVEGESGKDPLAVPTKRLHLLFVEYLEALSEEDGEDDEDGEGGKEGGQEANEETEGGGA